MNKRIIFLFIMGIVILVIVIFGVNILIKNKVKESIVSEPAFQREKQSPAELAPDKENKRLEKQEEEPEKESPIHNEGLLLN